jgi:hypothetical protein
MSIDEVDRILLVGGSSRIPLVGELLARLGRPVAVDTHPKHAVSLGAARLAAESATTGGAPPLASSSTTRSRPRWLLPTLFAAALVVVVLAVAAGALGSGEGGEATAVTTTTFDSGSTTTVAIADSPAELVGSYAVEFTLDECRGDGCAQTLSSDLEVLCTEASVAEGSCSVELSLADGMTALLGDPFGVGGDDFSATGQASLGFVVGCDPTVEQLADWSVTIAPGAGDDDLAATLAVDALDPSSCTAERATYGGAGRIGEIGDSVGEVAGTWNLVNDGFPQCFGDGGDCPPTLSFSLVVNCVGAVCTGDLDDEGPVSFVRSDIVSPAGLLLELFVQLPAGAGLTCAGSPEATTAVLTVEPLLDGQGRLVANLNLSPLDDLACAGFTVQSPMLGLPS